MERLNKKIAGMMKYVSDIYFKYYWDRNGTFKTPYHYDAMIKWREADDVSAKIFDLQDLYETCEAYQVYEKHQLKKDGLFDSDLYDIFDGFPIVTGIAETRGFNYFNEKLFRCFVINEVLNQDKNIEDFSCDFLMRLIDDKKIIYLNNFFNSDFRDVSTEGHHFRYSSYEDELNGLNAIDKLTRRCSDYVKLALLDYLVDTLLDIYDGNVLYVTMVLDTYLNGKDGSPIFKGNIKCFPENQTIEKIAKIFSHEEMLRILKLVTGTVENYVSVYYYSIRDYGNRFVSKIEEPQTPVRK